MSSKAYFWSREIGVHMSLKSSLRFVLRELADCHNQETHQCNPSVLHISKYTGLDRKTVLKSIESLDELDLLSTQKSNGKRTNYTLNFAFFDPLTSIKTSTEGGTGTESGTGTNNGTGAVPETVPVPVPKTVPKPITKPINNLKDIYMDLNLSGLSEKFDPEIVYAYIDYRKELNLSTQQVVFDDLMATASQPTSENFCPNQILIYAMGRKWTSLNLKWIRDAVKPDPDLLTKLAPSATQSSNASASESATSKWQEYGFKSSDDFVKYRELRIFLGTLESVPRPTETQVKQITSTREQLSALAPKKSQEKAA